MGEAGTAPCVARATWAAFRGDVQSVGVDSVLLGEVVCGDKRVTEQSILRTRVSRERISMQICNNSLIKCVYLK